MSNQYSNIFLGNIYPVPDPKFPFLGVHYTPRMNGDIWLGPNAVLALDREGYNLTSFNLKDMLEIARFSGIYKLVFKNIRAGIGELWRTFNLNAQGKVLLTKKNYCYKALLMPLLNSERFATFRARVETIGCDAWTCWCPCPSNEL